jgi:hypothetical protein
MRPPVFLDRKLVQIRVWPIVAVMSARGPLSAQASGNFYCAGKAGHGNIHLGANVDRDAEIVSPPRGHIRLSIEGREIDSTRVAITKGKTWTTLKDKESKALLLSFRRTTKKPLFLPGVDYEFCNEKNWEDSCWGAQIRYADPNGKERLIDAVCGSG